MTWWIAYARAKHEFEVADAIAALGIQARVAREVYAKHIPKKGIVPVTRPILPNYVFIHATDEDWHRIKGIKHLSPHMQPVTDREAIASLLPWMGRAERDYKARMRRIEAGERVAQYAPDDPLVIRAGALAGMTATFRRMVEASWPPAVIVAVGKIGGRDMEMQLDALHVRRAG